MPDKNSDIFDLPRGLCEGLRKLFISLVRPHLEFVSFVWNPYRQGDISNLEKVKRRSPKIHSKLKDLPYALRLKIWTVLFIIFQ